jgi:hypothetical protein
MTVFWDIAPCSLVEVDRCFRGAYRLYHQGDDNLKCHKEARSHQWTVSSDI